MNYLYALATSVRDSPSAKLAASIEDASRVLHTGTDGRTRIVTMRDLAHMNDVEGFV